MRIKMLHDHVSHDHLDIFGDLHVIDGKMDRNIAH